MEFVSVKRGMAQPTLAPFARNSEGRQKKSRKGRETLTGRKEL
jgi:hypothetical protein